MGNLHKRVQQRGQPQGVPPCAGAEQTVTRAMIVAEALTWEGTRFHHQEACKGAGCDCKGLVYGVAKTFGLDALAGYKDVKDYVRSVNGQRMRQLLNQYMNKKPKAEAQAGDVLWLSFLMFPQHLGILLPGNFIIHASEPDGAVIRHRMDARWWGRVCAVYAFKGVADG